MHTMLQDNYTWGHASVKIEMRGIVLFHLIIESNNFCENTSYQMRKQSIENIGI